MVVAGAVVVEAQAGVPALAGVAPIGGRVAPLVARHAIRGVTQFAGAVAVPVRRQSRAAQVAGPIDQKQVPDESVIHQPVMSSHGLHPFATSTLATNSPVPF